MAYETREFHPAFEEYCETIFELAEDGIDVIQARIVERLEVSRPAVSEMIKKTMPAPSDDTLILLCGPPKMISEAVRPNLEELNYSKESIFTF